MMLRHVKPRILFLLMAFTAVAEDSPGLLRIEMNLAILCERPLAGAFAADWPCWRGPVRNGVSAETGANWSWPAAGPKVLWKESVGKGFSSFAVVAGRAYTMGNHGDVDSVFCLDAATGKELWKHSYPCKLDPLAYEGGPSATPAVDGDRVYSLSKSGDCFCLDARTGRVVWSRKFETPATNQGDYRVWWGFAGSPLVLADKLILAVGGGGTALDKLTGKTLWQSGSGRSGYSSPVPFWVGADPCFAFMSGHEVAAVAAETGKSLWRIPWRTTWDQNAPDVVLANGKMLVSTGHGVGCALFDLATGRPVELWRNKNMRNELASSVLWKGHLYGFDSRRLACLDWETGALKWAAEGTGQGSLIVADNKLIALQEDGTLLVGEATGDGWKPLAKARVLTGRCWTAPVLSDGRVFVRNAEGAVACLDVRK
jgi:outer membrane protein assembly factor BamB